MTTPASPMYSSLNLSLFQTNILRTALIKFYVEIDLIPDEVFNATLREVGDMFSVLDQLIVQAKGEPVGMPCSSKADYMNEVDTIFMRLFGLSLRHVTKKARSQS